MICAALVGCVFGTSARSEGLLSAGAGLDALRTSWVVAAAVMAGLEETADAAVGGGLRCAQELKRGSATAQTEAVALANRDSCFAGYMPHACHEEHENSRGGRLEGFRKFALAGCAGKNTFLV